ncbi:amino acid adenylation domain-containing protein [Nonomuraea sp. MCN248]|uniref:Amino acid adenylation domain-containing protein n=1 Tax=Nonomuraea corallina TaxID=2989783 RepID=A0ABT4S9Z9_9ACTN|nr:non-ribosomal peptide synthetase [Nonomuraea corallina]MDA0634033.1 amino acid adenylation domain-containing protein [Nonomuraea corallina]
MEQFAPGTAAYTIPFVVRLRGDLDPARLRRALEAVVARHEILRTRFPADADGRPRVVVDDAGQVELRGVSAPDEAAARELLSAELARPFDLAAGPPVRALLVRLAGDDHVLLVALHHIAGDGWSLEILAGELRALYAGEEPPELALQYADFAVWQRGRPAEEADLAYWRERLAGVPPIELPLHGRRGAVATFAGDSHTFRLGADELAAAHRLAREHDATLFMVVLAVYQVLLARHSGQSDFAIGTPVGGRPRSELEPLIGMFVNMLAMRADLEDDPTFAELLARVRRSTLDAFAHQRLPFEQLVGELGLARDVSRTAVFQVALALRSYDEDSAAWPGLTVEPYPLTAGAAPFELELFLTERGGGLDGLFVYNRDLLARDTVEELGDRFGTLLRAALADPDLRVSDLELLTGPEREHVLALAAGPSVPYPADRTLGELFEEQAARTPDAVALEFGGLRLSYAELERRSGELARRLRELGARPGVRVAVAMERSLDLVVSLLAVVRAGAAYVPLDPDYPRERLDFMLRDARAAILLPEETVREREDLPDTPLTPACPAYMIYTSGSTGRPKGVPNSHAAIVNRLDWMQRRFGLTGADAVMQKTPAGFDVSVWEFFWPIITGARLVVAAPGGHRDTAYLRDLIVSSGVTTMHFVPSMLAAFLEEEDVERCGSLKRVICSGEELPVAVAARFFERLPEVELHNLYGPTEAAVDVTAWRCSPGESRIPIGHPVQNTRIHVLDARLRPVPPGVTGELYIGGVQVAIGYHDRPALTAERFLPDPYGPAGSRLYRTGDLARTDRDGAVEFLGRADDQIKIRGQRVEPGEVEAVLREQPGMREALVVADADGLVAYVVTEADPAGLRARLKELLPDHMVPTAYVRMDALPLSPNGKVDRSALPAPTRSSGGGALPGTPAEIAVAQIWSELLGVPGIRADDDFFDLGGHSLVAIQVVARIRKLLAPAEGRSVGVMDLFQHPTVRGLAQLIEGPAPAEDRPRELLHRLTRSRATPALTLVCFPYGGGSALVYQPLADALPEECALYSMAFPGHDPGRPDEPVMPLEEVIERAVQEIVDGIEGPIALYGHCGIGGAVTAEVARRLEARGREPVAVYIGAIFPFARPEGRIAGPLGRLLRTDRLRGDRSYENRMKAMGNDISGLDEEQVKFMVRNQRRDTLIAEEAFTRMLSQQARPLRAPVIAVVGEQDPATDYYRERYREWHFLSETTALVVLDEAGHYYLKYRADDLAQVLTNTHIALEYGAADELSRQARGPAAGWWVEKTSTRGGQDDPPPRKRAPEPGMRRFLAVSAFQLLSMVGTAVTDFAIPIWVYTTTGSLLNFALLVALAIMPGVLAAPLIGALVDRHGKRAMMALGNCAAGAVQLVFGVLLWTGTLATWHIYPLVALLSITLVFQRLAYTAALPQLVPKQYLGHAAGVVQLLAGTSQFVAPLLAVALLAGIGLGGILVIDVISFGVVLAALALIRFPATMALERRETLAAELAGGFRMSLGNRHLRSALLYFAVLNVMLAAVLMSISPLVLSFADLDTAGRISFIGGLGATLGGVIVALWGGPRRRRMRAVLLGTLVLSLFAVVTGMYASPLVVGLGAFGLWCSLSVVNGVFMTIIHVKVPQRFHGRVMAFNQMISWSTLPVGMAVVAPLGERLLEPLLMPGGALAGTVGAVIGVGQGRGIAFMYVLLGLGIAVLALVAMRIPVLAGFDEAVPEADPDDLVGARALRERAGNVVSLAWSAPAFAKALTMPLSAAKAGELLGEPVEKVLLRTGGEISAVYEVRTADRELIVKLYPGLFTERMRKERQVYDLLARTGAAAPAVVLADDSRRDLPQAYLVMTKVPGRPLSQVSAGLDRDTVERLYRDMGRLLRTVHSVTAPAFGPIDGVTEPTNDAYVGGQFELKAAHFAEFGGDPGLHAALLARLSADRHLLARCATPVLLHHDFHERNVMVARRDGRWELTGLIDVENALGGDPLMDLARTDYFAVRDDPLRRRALFEGYGDLPGDRDERLAFYRLYHALDQWHWLATIGEVSALEPITREIRACL